MPFASGKLEAISIKPLAQVDQYGNEFRSNVKVGEDWYSYGTLKKDSINIKDGSEWVQLQKGMEVEFQYTQNGDFKNIKKASFSITNKESVAPAPKVAPKPTGGYSSVNPAKIGMFLNWCKDLLEFKKSDFEDEEKLADAATWFNNMNAKATDIYTQVESGSYTAKKADKKPPFKEDEVLDEDI